MLVLVIYDIPDHKRRKKLSDFLEGYGRRVQRSAFECFLNLGEMKKLYEQLTKRVVPAEDNVRLYWINADAMPRTLTLGSRPPQPPPDAYVL
ncbi:CRISPR-associated endonuclease Cas2 [Leptolyngbya cf. ectocarpi LEGE 11479]|uniref:CRISPR-associated endoribonuclease Cas2 n=1 Tax=Leptolyngbya cf. ectocarpi LEGE 11479 TaxID=1828722 RepID=A0A928ZZP3_LEPEC|nr:CRISPR-associated endonuclease Cas2 [Leptolyngbya ectocarpi]MBE9070338.1 CRISPR-associated endonuclease Cas2 [Leptolyngbya cf. ectocarpi LEGE 11479]